MYSLYTHFSISRCFILFLIWGCYVNSTILNQLDVYSREGCIPSSYEDVISEHGPVVLTLCKPYADHLYDKVLFSNNVIWQSTDGILSYAVWIDEVFKIIICDLLYPNGHKSYKCFKQVGNKWENASVTGYFLFGDIDESALSLIPEVDKSTAELITTFVDSEETNANYNEPFPHLGSIETTMVNEQCNNIKSCFKKEKGKSSSKATNVAINEHVHIIYYEPETEPCGLLCLKRIFRYLVKCIVTFYSEIR